MKLRKAFLVLSAAFLLSGCKYVYNITGQGGNGNQTSTQQEPDAPELNGLVDKYNGWQITYMSNTSKILVGGKDNLFWMYITSLTDNSISATTEISEKVDGKWNNYMWNDINSKFTRVSAESSTADAIRDANQFYLESFQMNGGLNGLTGESTKLDGNDCKKYDVKNYHGNGDGVGVYVYVSTVYGVCMQMEYYNTENPTYWNFAGFATGTAVQKIQFNYEVL